MKKTYHYIYKPVWKITAVRQVVHMPKSKKEKAQEELEKAKRMRSVLNMLEKSGLEDLLLYSPEGPEVNADESHIDKRLDQLSKEIEKNSKSLESIKHGNDAHASRAAMHKNKHSIKKATSTKVEKAKAKGNGKGKANAKKKMKKHAFHASPLQKGRAVKKPKLMARNKKTKVKK